MRSAIWLALGLLVGWSVPTVASTLNAQGVFSVADAGLEWSSGCSEPDFPDFESVAPWQVESIRQRLTNFEACVKNHARDDSEYATQVIADSAQTEVQSTERDASARGWSAN